MQLNDYILNQLKLGPTPTHGLLLSFSGIDASGKTTTIRTTASYLRSQGFSVRIFKLPSNEIKKTKMFQRYKEAPLSVEALGSVDIFSLGLVVLGDRLNTIKTEIIPLLYNGYVVIVDRYVYSAIVELILSSEVVIKNNLSFIQSILAQFPKPHVSFFNRVSFVEARNRIRNRPLEKEDSLDSILFNKRIELFEILRLSFNGVLVDTALDQKSCQKIVIRSIKKVLKEINEKTN